jgi:PQQ enzyme repeat
VESSGAANAFGSRTRRGQWPAKMGIQFADVQSRIQWSTRNRGGGLVFGAVGGVLFALDMDTGREVWRLPLGGSTVAAPISFSIDGRQVIALAAGRALFVFGL